MRTARNHLSVLRARLGSGLSHAAPPRLTEMRDALRERLYILFTLFRR